MAVRFRMAPLLRRRLGVIVGLALLPVLGGPVPALGDTIEQKRAEASVIQTELEAKGRAVSVAAEEYNRAQLRLGEVRDSLAEARTDLTRADQRMEDARRRVAEAAVLAYVGGGSSGILSRLARATSTDDLIVRRQYLRFAASNHQQVVGEMRAVKEDLSLLRVRLESEERAARTATASADDLRLAARAAESAHRAILARVQGELAGLVAAEAARRDQQQAASAPAPASLLQPSVAPAAAAPAQSRAPEPAPAAAVAPNDRAAIAVAEAKKQIGKPYVWGGSGPDSFDCSGLTAWAWKAAGVYLSHSAYTQYFETTRVPVDQVQPGDLLFFGPDVEGIHHNAIYVGGGEMIEASQTGVPIRYRGWRAKDLVGVGRPG